MTSSRPRLCQQRRPARRLLPDVPTERRHAGGRADPQSPAQMETPKMMQRYLALTALLAATATAEAGTLAPYEAESIALGNVVGVAYYVEQPDGFHVVA